MLMTIVGNVRAHMWAARANLAYLMDWMNGGDDKQDIARAHD